MAWNGFRAEEGLVELEKGPGYDWIITYQFDHEPVETMNVFGQIRIEDAVAEARLSFDEEDQPLLMILGAERTE